MVHIFRSQADWISISYERRKGRKKLAEKFESPVDEFELRTSRWPSQCIDHQTMATSWNNKLANPKPSNYVTTNPFVHWKEKLWKKVQNFNKDCELFSPQTEMERLFFPFPWELLPLHQSHFPSWHFDIESVLLRWIHPCEGFSSGIGKRFNLIQIFIFSQQSKIRAEKMSFNTKENYQFKWKKQSLS